MNWLDFTSSVIGAIAWPIAVVSLVVVLRKPLGAVIGNLRPTQMRAGGIEVDFEVRADAAVEAAEAAELPEPELGVDESETASRLGLLVREAPRAAVLEAWLTVETEQNKLAAAYGVQSTVHALKANGAVSAELGALIRQLRKLRNAAIHADEFSITETGATQYAEACGRVAAALRAARETLAAAAVPPS